MSFWSPKSVTLPSVATRNRPATEQRLKEAVKALIVAGGFGALTPAAVGRQAGVDKMLIYRYFGGIEGLVAAVAREPGFFADLEELADGDIAATRARPIADRVAAVSLAYARSLMRRPVVLELMVWEMVERNALTAIMEEQREIMGLRIAAELFGDAGAPADANAISAILGAAMSYLVLRRRKIRLFSGIDLRSDEGWERLDRAVRLMAGALGG
jgi:AcrR family transcriptional regulator